ncbi:hypothetical protein CTA1_5952 [Colletotrichum tanaceti]|uniref:Uncharacterized protein n=1 Tax=Colletotrichum tanaceti TaxID=1306861 RepID=A0A4U6XBX0_9PEZI|nr:hypothetical protein CTA1_5952 [Colletotrichum tanaceti]
MRRMTRMSMTTVTTTTTTTTTKTFRLGQSFPRFMKTGQTGRNSPVHSSNTTLASTRTNGRAAGRVGIMSIASRNTFIADLQAHARCADACEVREPEALDGITQDQEKRLRSRKKTSARELTEADKWTQVYSILFPDLALFRGYQQLESQERRHLPGPQGVEASTLPSQTDRSTTTSWSTNDTSPSTMATSGTTPEIQVPDPLEIFNADAIPDFEFDFLSHVPFPEEKEPDLDLEFGFTQSFDAQQPATIQPVMELLSGQQFSLPQ